MNKPIIFCCNSGHRSRQALAIMKEKGLKEGYVVGNWERLLRIVNSLKHIFLSIKNLRFLMHFLSILHNFSMKSWI